MNYQIAYNQKIQNGLPEVSTEELRKIQWMHTHGNQDIHINNIKLKSKKLVSLSAEIPIRK